MNIITIKAKYITHAGYVNYLINEMESLGYLTPDVYQDLDLDNNPMDAIGRAKVWDIATDETVNKIINLPTFAEYEAQQPAFL